MAKNFSKTGNTDRGVNQMPQYRKSMSPDESKRHFTKHATGVHKYNLPNRLPMRGGIRM